jgi:hypothetical protein
MTQPGDHALDVVLSFSGQRGATPGDDSSDSAHGYATARRFSANSSTTA